MNPKFGEDFIHKNFPVMTSNPNIALAELIANAWDAGATEVRINLTDDSVSIEDNGIGMTSEQFNNIWNTLRYTRSTEPVIVNGKRRMVFGKNGVGRYSIFCFTDSYQLTISRNNIENIYLIEEVKHLSTSNINVKNLGERFTGRTGLKYDFINNKKLTDDLVVNVAKRFIADPEFHLYLNNKEISLFSLDDKQIIYEDENIKIYRYYSEDSTRLMFKGIAFWVARRLIGKPSWYGLQDGRHAIAKKNSYIVIADCLENEIEDDWSNFRETEKVETIKELAKNRILEHLSELWKESKQSLKKNHIDKFKQELIGLPIASRNKIATYVETIYDVMATPPQEDTVNASISALIIQEKSANGQQLLSTISKMKPSDIDTLTDILKQWTVEDINKVLFEIDYRLKIIEAIGRVMGDKNTNELYVLHPLVLESRWLFGPQYDTLEYTSNKRITTVLKEILGTITDEKIVDRPDIVVKEDACMTNYLLEDIHGDFAVPSHLLIIELKRGGYKIGFDEMMQANKYITQLITKVQPEPKIKAYVVGHEISENAQYQSIGKNNEHRIEPITYAMLVATARKRLLNLQNNLTRYQNMPTHTLLESINKDGVQLSLEQYLAKNP